MKNTKTQSKSRSPLSVFGLPVMALLVVLAPSAALSQSVEEMMNNGNEMLSRGAFSQAVTIYRQVLGREPRNFEAQYNMAFAYLGWGRNSNAVEEFKKALGLKPGSSEAWANIAVAYEKMGKTGEALDALGKAVKADPSNITARVNLAAMYANNNKLSQAINEYTALVKIEGVEPAVYVNLAKCLITAKRLDEAKKYLAEAIVAEPGNVEAHWELAHIYWKNDKNTVKAKQELNLAISARPEVPTLYEGLAGILEEEGDKKGAVQQLNKAMAFTTEVLDKERLKIWIDKLEGRTAGNTGSGSPSPQMGGMQTLKREDETRTKTKTTKNTPAVKVDMGDLLEEDQGAAKDPFGDIGKKK